MAMQRMVIIGGGAAGIAAALHAREANGEVEITIISQGVSISPESFLSIGNPCFQSYLTKEGTFGPMQGAICLKELWNIELHLRHKVIHIAPSEKLLQVQELDTGRTCEVGYDRLIIATGIRFQRPDIQGIDLLNVFAWKDKVEFSQLKERIHQRLVKKAVVIGGGCTGLEIAQSFIQKEIPVTVIEGESDVSLEFDSSMSQLVQHGIDKKAVEFFTGEQILSCIGNVRGEVVEVHTLERIIYCDTVVIACGLRPETWLAEQSGILLGSHGAIWVDSTMETQIPYIYAAGGCTQLSSIRMAGVAGTHAGQSL